MTSPDQSACFILLDACDWLRAGQVTNQGISWNPGEWRFISVRNRGYLRPACGSWRDVMSAVAVGGLVPQRQSYLGEDDSSK